MTWPRTTEFYEDDWDEGSAYESTREALSDVFAEASDAEIEAVLIEAGIDPAQMEGFFSSLKKGFSKIGKAALKIAPKALPVIGGAVGTIFGGPVGTALGGKLGSLAGRAIGAAGRPRRGRRVRRRVIRRGSPALPQVTANPAASNLLRTILRPDVINALLAMTMGQAGRKNVVVGKQSVPVGAITNLIGMLAREATAEHHQAVGGGEEGIPGYLVDEYGELAADPTSAEERAARLLELFIEADMAEEQADWSNSEDDIFDELDADEEWDWEEADAFAEDNYDDGGEWLEDDLLLEDMAEMFDEDWD